MYNFNIENELSEIQLNLGGKSFSLLVGEKKVDQVRFDIGCDSAVYGLDHNISLTMMVSPEIEAMDEMTRKGIYSKILSNGVSQYQEYVKAEAERKAFATQAEQSADEK